MYSTTFVLLLTAVAGSTGVAASVDGVVNEAPGAQQQPLGVSNVPEVLPFAFASLSSSDGTSCAVCTLLVGVLEQYIAVHNATALEVLEDVCELLPNKTRPACETAVKLFGPALVDNLDKDLVADDVCQNLKLCDGTCRLFPKKKTTQPEGSAGEAGVAHPRHLFHAVSSAHRHLQATAGAGEGGTPAICKLPVIKEVCEAFYNWGNDNEPLDDEDKDGFSPITTFRGADWRGRDCDDKQTAVHPGAKPVDMDRETDSNCNGIFGVDPTTGTPYEELFCSSTAHMGIVVLGDSASAHFHIPPDYLTAQNINETTFKNLLTVAENEADWPMFSATTGFVANDTVFAQDITGKVNSTYLVARGKNRCLHRDFQNIAVNGARSGAMNDHIQQTMSRNQTGDYPVSLMYALIGNDVCNGHIDDYVNHMTKPSEMRENVLGTLAYLDETLPAGSHVTLMGLADGMILFDSMHDQIHPVGKLRNDVTYAQVYDYLNCLEISPCGGWMTSNDTLRNLTQTRANELSDVLKDVVDNATATKAYKNFDTFYFPNPIKDILTEWEAQGGQAWQLIEPVDGFHPNQFTQPFVVQKYFQWATENGYPLIPEANPHNDEIVKQFGDQGGY